MLKTKFSSKKMTAFVGLVPLLTLFFVFGGISDPQTEKGLAKRSLTGHQKQLYPAAIEDFGVLNEQNVLERVKILTYVDTEASQKEIEAKADSFKTMSIVLLKQSRRDKGSLELNLKEGLSKFLVHGKVKKVKIQISK